jgi:hypothetical protein
MKDLQKKNNNKAVPLLTTACFIDSSSLSVASACLDHQAKYEKSSDRFVKNRNFERI